MDDQKKPPISSEKASSNAKKASNNEDIDQVLGSITDPQELNIAQTLPQQPGVKAAGLVNPTTPELKKPEEKKPTEVKAPTSPTPAITLASAPANAAVISKQINPLPAPPSTIKFSAYSLALKSYNKKVTIEKLILLITVIALAGVIYYFGFYRPIGIYSTFTMIVHDMEHLVKK